MLLSAGKRVGAYEIVALIGTGGMGEVYRARDTLLSRDVALKVLPPRFADDPERLARFRREAEVLASLDHPHIAAIYGIEQSGGITALVLQLVNGATLAERIARGPIPVHEALPIARQIAEALDNAHAHGIIHRDLKPANIALTHDDYVKVLDFGLAKVFDSSPPAIELSQLPTMTAPAETRAGMILGTAPYMSPEQAGSKRVDKRADIWAFGVVLYEMLTGRRLFDGENPSETIASILKDPPSLGTLPSDVPPAVIRLLRRCVEKDPGRRLRDIGDAVIELDDALRLEDPSLSMPHRVPQWAIAVTCLLALLAAAGWFRRTPDRSEESPFALTIVPPSGLELARAGGMSSAPELSPDGSKVLFATTNGLYVRPLRSLVAERIAGSEQFINAPFWSADSAAVVFSVADRRLMKVRLPGGAPELVAPLPGPSRGGSWGDAGTILIWAGELLAIPASGGEPARVKTSRGACLFPEFLPDSDDFLCFSPSADDATGGDVYLATLRGGEATDPVQLARAETAPHYTPAGGGRLLFVRNNNLYSQTLNPGARRLEGEAELVVEGVASQPTGAFHADFSVSRSGTIAWRAGRAAFAQVTMFDRRGSRLGTSGPLGPISNIVLSPDGTQLLTGGGERSWVIDVGEPGRLALPIDTAWFDWLSDGTNVVGLQADGRLIQWAIGGASEVRVRGRIPALTGVQPQDLSPDGRSLLLMRAGARGLLSVQLEGSTPDGGVKTLLPDDVPAFDARFSPDGRSIVYVSRETNPIGSLVVQPFPGPGRRRQIAPQGSDPAWRGDGHEVVYLGPDRGVWSVEVEKKEGDGYLIGTPERLFAPVRIPAALLSERQLALSADGTRIFIPEAVEQPEAGVMHVMRGWTGVANDGSASPSPR